MDGRFVEGKGVGGGDWCTGAILVKGSSVNSSLQEVQKAKLVVQEVISCNFKSNIVPVFRPNY